MSNLEPYGVGNDVVVPNNNNSGAQSSQNSVGLFSNMRFSYNTTDGAAVYKPVMPPTSPHSASPTRQPAYHAAGDGGDGSAMAAAPPSVNASSVQQTKRKRGRPRKYTLDGAMTSPPPVPLPQLEGVFPPSGFSAPAAVPSSGKKSRGRPPGSGRKQQVSTMGLTGVGFTPHVITVKAGEDVSSKIVSFSQNGSRAICILSANGAISNVTLCQAATSGGTVTYEGRFEILSLSGSYMLLENGGQRSRTGGLSVLLAGPDGRVLGGGVAGVLTAAAPVQVVVGCFSQGQEESNPPNQADPSPAPANFVPGASPGGTPSESSGGPGSPLNQSTEVCNNINLHGNPTFSWQ